MSMRVGGQTDVNPVEKPRSVAPKAVETEAKTNAESSSENTSADHAELSSASNLVALAKATPTVKQEKLAALAARVGSGSYKPASREISRSIVQSLLKE